MSDGIIFEPLTTLDYSASVDAALPALRFTGASGIDAALPALAGATWPAYGITASLPVLQGFAGPAAGGLLDAHLPALVGTAGEGGVSPSEASLLVATLPGLTADLAITSHGSIRIDVDLPALAARIYEAGPSVLDVTLDALTAHLGAQTPLTTHLYLQHPEPYMLLTSGYLYTAVTEVASITASTDVASMSVQLRERFGLSAPSQSLLTATSHAEDAFAFAEALGIVWQVVVSEMAHLGDTAGQAVTAVRQVVETLLLTGVARSTNEAYAAIASVLQLHPETAAAWHGAIREALAVTEGADAVFSALQSVVEKLDLGDTMSPSLTATAVVHEALGIAPEAATALEAAVGIRESMAAAVRIVVNGDEYSCWLINTESKGVARYTNYPFNSFAKLHGVYIGATSTGLERLDGDDDDGEAIRATIRTGLHNFGTSSIKRVPDILLGYTADNDLVVKVITTSGSGEKVEHWYRTVPRRADAMREGNIKPGKGLKSVYWGFELVSTGGNVALDVVEWLPFTGARKLT